MEVGKRKVETRVRAKWAAGGRKRGEGSVLRNAAGEEVEQSLCGKEAPVEGVQAP